MAEFSSFKNSELNLIDLSSPDVNSSVSLLKQEKMHNLRNEKHRGYAPFFDQNLDPANQINGDYKESYIIGDEVSDDEPNANRPLCGQNRWPPSDILPNWRETMERYQQEALNMGRAVARLIALALDLNADFFDQTKLMGTLRLLRYGDEIGDPDKGIFGVGAHSDFGFITILASDVYGLQICKDKDAKPQVWEYVPPVKGAFIVNLGDMLERWSNCIFRSTLHRVIGIGQERFSIVYFVEPDYDCIVECLPTCRSENNLS